MAIWRAMSACLGIDSRVMFMRCLRGRDMNEGWRDGSENDERGLRGKEVWTREQ